MKNQYFWVQEATQNDPRSSQDGPKTVLCRFFFRFVFCIDFLSLFGSILVPFGGAFGSPNRSFLASIFWWFLHVVPRSPQERPRAAQERPRASQEPPKSAQERPKGGQERPKSGQRAPKRRPRAPKSGQESPKSGKKWPKRAQDTRKESEKVTRTAQANQKTKARYK